ncbi:MAG: hypothetical protein WAM30_12700 [Candidatus Dormiibacterota bacterium]
MTIVDARNVWSRAMAQMEAGALTQDGLATARARLEAIRDRLALPERSRVALYLDLLDQAWEDRSLRPDAGRASDRLLAAHQVLAAGFLESGDAVTRRARAESAVRELSRLAAASPDEREQHAIRRLGEPLQRLLSALAPAPSSGVAR